MLPRIETVKITSMEKESSKLFCKNKTLFETINKANEILGIIALLDIKSYMKKDVNIINGNKNTFQMGS